MAQTRSERLPRILAALFLSTTLLLAVALAGSWWWFHQLTLTLPTPEPQPVPQPAELHASNERVSPLLVSYKLDLPGRGEIFPALTSEARDYWPVAILSVSNTSKRPVLQAIAAEVPGWTQRATQTVVLGPQETRTLRLSPPLLPKAFGSGETQRATLNVRVTDENGTTAFAQTRPVIIHAAGELYWGKQFENAQIVARWVTPHDPAVLQLLSDSRRYITNGRMPGYNISQKNAAALPAQVRRQAEAVFSAMRKSEISYVNSLFTFGDLASSTQRIRLPRETLTLNSANCMDVSVAFASAMENLGMKPVIVIVPGHAFTGVRLGPDSSEILYLDLTVLPKGSFSRAAARANYWMEKTSADRVLTVDVASARRMGIYPLPTPGAQPDSNTASSATSNKDES
jgi:hypothetical protein